MPRPPVTAGIDPPTLHCCIREVLLTSLNQSHWPSQPPSSNPTRASFPEGKETSLARSSRIKQPGYAQAPRLVLYQLHLNGFTAPTVQAVGDKKPPRGGIPLGIQARILAGGERGIRGGRWLGRAVSKVKRGAGQGSRRRRFCERHIGVVFTGVGVGSRQW